MSQSLNNELSFKCTSTIGPCRFVTIDSNFDEQVKQSTTSDFPIGVSHEGQRDAPGLAGSDTTIAGKSGDWGMRVVGLGNDCELELGGTVASGDSLKPDVDGKGVTASSGDYAGGRALQKGTSGVKIRVLVHPHKF